MYGRLLIPDRQFDLVLSEQVTESATSLRVMRAPVLRNLAMMDTLSVRRP
jgi:hypothetical protein